MRFSLRKAKHALAALLAFVTLGFSADAQTETLDALFERLQSPELADWETVEQEIWLEWSKSGSPAMDLLLQRGRAAMDEGQVEVAIEHFTALTDHAPEFAEGWNARATAFFVSKLYGPSIDDIRKTLALNPRHFGALSGLGIILEELDQDEDALAAYRAAIAIHPHRPDLKEAIDRLEAATEGVEL